MSRATRCGHRFLSPIAPRIRAQTVMHESLRVSVFPDPDTEVLLHGCGRDKWTNGMALRNKSVSSPAPRDTTIATYRYRDHDIF